MNVHSAGATDTGQHREQNEDSLCVYPEFDLYVVADGMGGHKAGDVASKMATHVVGSVFLATAREDATWPFHFDAKLTVEENRLQTAVRVANKRIFDTSVKNHDVHMMGTTIVGIVVSKDRKRMYMAHVGDSRCYRIRAGEIAQMTRDHSLLNDYLTVMPDMTQEQRDELPKNVITRALGMQENVDVEMRAETPVEGDLYLLCSDGLSGMITETEMLTSIMGSSSLDDMAISLVAKANDNGGEDNITVVLVQFAA